MFESLLRVGEDVSCRLAVVALLCSLPFSVIEAAEEEIAEQCILFGEMLEKGASTSDIAEALSTCQKAVIAQPDNATLSFHYGKVLTIDSQPDEAFTWFMKAAEAGYAPAQTAVGSAYVFGYGVQTDLKAGLPWWKRAADAGDAEGQYRYGVHLAFHSGPRPNSRELEKNARNIAAGEERIHLIKEAAHKGLSMAQQDLGSIYQRGMIVPQDLEKAFHWFRLAAAHDDLSGRNAKVLLGRFYEHGLGEVSINREEAARLYIEAEEAGSRAVKRDLDRLYANAPAIDLMYMPPRQAETAPTQQASVQNNDTSVPPLVSILVQMKQRENANRRAMLRDTLGDIEWQAPYWCRQEMWRDAGNTRSDILTICYTEDGDYYEARGLDPCVKQEGWCNRDWREAWSVN